MGTVTWEEAAAELRGALLDDGLRRAVASGRSDPGIQRAVVRPVVVKRGPALQIVFEDGVRPTTRTLALGQEASAGVDELLSDGFRNWHVETAARTVKVQTSKKGKILLSVGGPVATPPAASGPDRTGGHDGVVGHDRAVGHDRVKEHLIDPGDPLFDVIGGDARKRRQVDAFLRALDATLPAEPPSPLRVVDLGCGNAYLTFAAYRYLSDRVAEIHLTGVDVREDQRDRNTALARQLGFTGLEFVAGTILDADVPAGADLVLALHACDTATDEALARAVGWDAQWILAAPCCHKDVSRQLRASGRTSALTRSGILRERFADVLTDAFRSAILREHGYAVDVVEFVDSAHTPRNLLLKATRTGRSDGTDLAALTAEWPVTPQLAKLLR